MSKILARSQERRVNMKRLFNATVGGYYLCSIVLGIAMALTVGLAACDMWDYGVEQYCLAENIARMEYPDGGFTDWYDAPVDSETYSVNYDEGVFYLKGSGPTEAAWVKLSRRFNRLTKLSHYLPMEDLWYRMNVHREWGYDQYGEYLLATVAIMTVMLSVIIMEGKAANKAWRQKMLQAFGIAAFIVLIDIAYHCARDRVHYGELSTVELLMPVAFLLIPALILKKTRSPKKEAEVRNPNEAKKIVVPHGVCDDSQ